MTTGTPEPPDSYPALLAELKQRIRSTRLRAALSVNRELILLYWSIGRDILARQRAEGWGAKVIDRFGATIRARRWCVTCGLSLPPIADPLRPAIPKCRNPPKSG